MKVEHPGIYEMSLADYVADPCPQPSFNTSMAVAILTQSPLHAKMQNRRLNPNAEREESSRMDLGTIAHALLLEEDGSKVVEIEADDWRTKAAKEKRDEARAAGKIPVLVDDLRSVRKMVEVAQHFMMGSDLCEDWLSAKAEQTLVWRDAEGFWCRSRPDKLTPDYRIYFDYKSTGSAHPAAFVKTAINQGYDLQVALGIQGVKTLTHGEKCTAVFLVQEIDAPYACSLVTLSPMFTTIAEERLFRAQEKWRACLQFNEWPGYPSRLATVDPPGWYGMDEEEGL